jgi:hypothetical protein
MAKRKGQKAKKAAKRVKAARRAAKRAPARRSAKRPSKKRQTRRKSAAPKKAARKPAARKAPVPRKPARKMASRPKAANAAPAKVPRLERARRTLEETVQTPPSSLNMDRRGSAARTGRAEIAQHLRERHGMEDLAAGPGHRGRHRQGAGRAVRGQRRAETRRQGRRTRQTPVGVGSRLFRRLQGQEVESAPMKV